MEDCIMLGILILIIVFSLSVGTVKMPRKSRLDIDYKARFERKEKNLKEIYANMAEFDRLIKERDEAIQKGDTHLYRAKVIEAAKCFEEGNRLCNENKD